MIPDCIPPFEVGIVTDGGPDDIDVALVPPTLTVTQGTALMNEQLSRG